MPADGCPVTPKCACGVAVADLLGLYARGVSGLEPQTDDEHLQTGNGVADRLLHQHLAVSVQHTQLMARPFPIHTSQ